MKHSIFAVIMISVAFSVISSLQLDPPLWPQHFSQSFQVETRYSNQTGRMWFDYTNLKFRYDFDHPDKDMFCTQFSQYQLPCTHLWSNQKLYIFVAEEELCCFYDSPGFVPRDWLNQSNYIFTGETYRDGQYFYRWQRYNYTHIEYLTDKSEKMIPKRDAKDGIIFDFWLDSYNDNPIKPSFFAVPDYCQKPCNQSTEGQQQIHAFGVKKISDLVHSQIEKNSQKATQLITKQQ